MAKKSTGFGGKSGGKSRWDWIFYGVLLILVGMAIWAIIQNDIWSQMTSWYDGVYSNIRDAVGLGSIFIILAILTLIFLIWRRQVLSLFRNGLKWLGAIVLVFAAWGILAFFDLAEPLAWELSARRTYRVR